MVFRVLILSFFLVNHYADIGFVVPSFPEFNFTVGQGKKGMVFTHSNIQTGMVYGSPLSDNDVSGFGKLTTVNFNA